MTVERETLPRWRYPSDKVLKHQVFPSGRPPFGPFPTVTDLLNASLCPVALYHSMIHGIDDAFIIGDPILKRRGNLFHGFVEYLKSSLRNGGLQLGSGYSSQIGTAQSIFLRFAQEQGFTLDETTDYWRLDIEPWVTRKLQRGELQSISADDRLFFEISIGNPHLLFPLDGGERRYPLRGRIDEVDLTNQKVIERTVRLGSDKIPPALKDYQVWLLWTMLSSIDRDALPPTWRNVDFDSFKIVVETPRQDYPLDAQLVNRQDGHSFIMDTHYAYAWINDLAVSEYPGAFQEAWNFRCAPENPDRPDCRHLWRSCYTRGYVHPRSRPEMRQAFQPWYRLLLWEQMWAGHLWHYQVLLLERETLAKLGLIIEAEIVSAHDSEIRLDIGKKTNTLRGYEYCTIIPYGSVFCGRKMNARFLTGEGSILTFQLEDRLPEFSEEAILMMSPELSSPIMREPPMFLDQRTQKGLFSLTHMGTSDDRKAQARSPIQLLESVFGVRPLRREVPRAEK